MSEANFITNILLKNIIGKELITDDNLAVFELVKNSFDAGSPSVIIEYINLNINDDHINMMIPTSQTSKLIIKDLGSGMNQDDLRYKWLNIAYSEKKERKENFGRIQAGNKGVGRFSCDRLGHFLTIYTRKRNNPYYKIFIDWRSFENEDQQETVIQDIKFSIEEISDNDFNIKSGHKEFIQGTILEIAYLREGWTREKILKLKRKLENLINPNQAFTITTFDIYLRADDYKQSDATIPEILNRVNGKIENKIFDKLNFKTSSILADIDNRGEFITTTLQDRGINVFVLKEKNIFPRLRNIKITVYYLNTYAKRYFTLQTGIRSVNFGSIFLFINGFRVPPYGDDGDDWLGLEIRKGQGYNRYLGTREIVGRIEISENEDEFKIISNRSGVVNNVAFEQLTQSNGFFYKILRRLERFVVDDIQWDKTGDILTKEGGDGEKFKLDDLTRSKKILSVIKNIADSKDDNICSLTYNENFIKNIIDQQIDYSSENLDRMVKDISVLTKDIHPEVLERYKQHLGENSLDLERLVNMLKGVPVDMSANVDRLKTLQDTINSEQTEISKMKDEVEKAIEARRQSEARQEQLQKELEFEREKNTYLRTSSRNLSEDAKGLVHNIKLVSTKINSSISTLYDKLKSDSITKADLFKELGKIKFQSEKIFKISKIITRANFKADSAFQFIDIVGYISQYISIYKDIYEDSELQFLLHTNNSTFKRKISVLELALILDDMISNSEKAGATIVQINISNDTPETLEIVISDNGKGVDPKFDDCPDKIFELGVTTTNGSGIGLNSVRTALKNMKATITNVGNGKILSGACFTINF